MKKAELIGIIAEKDKEIKSLQKERNEYKRSYEKLLSQSNEVTQ